MIEFGFRAGRDGNASLRGGVAERLDGAEDNDDDPDLAGISSSSEYPQTVSPSESTSFVRCGVI